MTQEQIRAIKAYVHSSTDSFEENEKFNTIELSISGFTFQINAILRANLALTSKVDQYLNMLDSAFINHQILSSQTVYRACNYLEMIRYISNQTYLDYGYMSTSKSIECTERFFQEHVFGYSPAFLKIHIPEGSNVLDLDGVAGFENSTYEDEILFKRKSIFQIVQNKTVNREDLHNEFGLDVIYDDSNIQFLELNYLRTM